MSPKLEKTLVFLKKAIVVIWRFALVFIKVFWYIFERVFLMAFLTVLTV